MNLSTQNLIDDLERWYKAYLSHLVSLSYAKNTIALYCRNIELFIEYMRQFQDETTMTEIKTVHFTNFLYYAEEIYSKGGVAKKHAKTTKEAYLKSLKGFFSFINDHNEELFTYERYFKNLRVADTSQQQDKIVHLSEDEVTRLMRVLEREKDTRKRTAQAYRNALLVKTMLHGGLRISEALRLRLEDISMDDKETTYLLRITGKGGKAQTAYVAAKILFDEVEFFRSNGIGARDFLLATSSGKQLQRDEAYRIVNGIYKRASVRKTGLHILRHTLAMRLTKRGINPLVIQKILRHNSLNTTTVYAKADAVDAQRALGNL